jgi:hypothetical protein
VEGSGKVCTLAPYEGADGHVIGRGGCTWVYDGLPIGRCGSEEAARLAGQRQRSGGSARPPSHKQRPTPAGLPQCGTHACVLRSRPAAGTGGGRPVTKTALLTRMMRRAPLCCAQCAVRMPTGRGRGGGSREVELWRWPGRILVQGARLTPDLSQLAALIPTTTRHVRTQTVEARLA